MASYQSSVFQGTSLYRWSGSTSDTDCMAQGSYSTWASGGSQAGRAYFSGLNNIDLNRYKITQVNVSMHFGYAGHDAKKWVQFYFSSYANSDYAANIFRTTTEAYNADMHYTWYDEATILNFEKSLKNGNCYICCYNGETSSSEHSENYLKITSIYLSYVYEDREDIKLRGYNGSEWVYPAGAYYREESTLSPVIEVPHFALMSDEGSAGYSCSATTYYGSGNDAYKVFDKDTTTNNNCWASSLNVTGNQTIYLNLPKKGYLKTIKIYNRVWQNDANVRGPIDLNIKAKINASDSGEILLTSATNLAGARSGHGTVIHIPEAAQEILIETICVEITNWHTKGTSGTHVCVGEIIPYVQYETVTVPQLALTSNTGSEGYSCEASSSFSTSETAYNAFDYNNNTYWSASSGTSETESLWLNLPKKAKVRSITLQNRNYSLVYGPISVYIKGKINIEDTETIPLSNLITNLPGSTQLASTTILIEEPYNQIEVQQILIEIVDWDGKANSANPSLAGVHAEVIFPWRKIKKALYYEPSLPTITVPPMALPSNSGIMGYSCGASSVWASAGNEAFRAFDKDSTTNNNCWASVLEATDTQTLYLTLPKSGYLKTVTISNRVWNIDSYVRGPLLVNIKIKSAPEDSTSQIVASNIELPGTISGAKTVIEIPENYQNILMQEILIDILDWQTKGETGSHLCIGEVSAEVTYFTETIPPFALTSNSGTEGYYCYSSSAFDANFPAYLAFNKTEDVNSIWASAGNDTKPILYFGFPKLGCVKSITFTNRAENTYGVHGPIKILIWGKQDILSVQEIPLCSTYLTLPGDTASAKTTITIEEGYNNIPVKEIIIEILEWGANSTEYCAIAELSAEMAYSWR